MPLSLRISACGRLLPLARFEIRLCIVRISGRSGWRVADLVKLDILVNGDPVDAVSLIVRLDRTAHVNR